MEHLKSNKWIYLSLMSFVVVVYFFSKYALGYGDSGIQEFIFDHQPLISADEINAGLEQLGPAGIDYYSFMYSSGLDFFYPLTFSVFSFFLLSKAFGDSRSLRYLLILPAALFLVDCAENLSIMSILSAYPESASGADCLGYIVAVKTGLKWVAYLLVVISLLTLLKRKTQELRIT